jgi:hypothetical protein
VYVTCIGAYSDQNENGSAEIEKQINNNGKAITNGSNNADL